MSATLLRPQPMLSFDRSRRCREIGHGDQNMVKLDGVPVRGHGR